jgi:hypothetical protein
MTGQLGMFDSCGRAIDHVAADARAERLARMRDDLETDWRNPGTRLTVATAARDDAPGVRCGRCGEVVFRYDVGINHDLGWCGCPRDGDWARGRQLHDRPDAMNERADRELAPDCARCGCAWGLHRGHGAKLPCEESCYRWCGCPGYVAPPSAETPFGTCPGCWSKPHHGPCRPDARGRSRPGTEGVE